MNCREVVDFLQSYLDRELDQTSRSLLEAHLAECPECVAYLRSYQTTVNLVQRLSRAEEDLPPSLEHVIQTILSSRMPTSNTSA